MREENFCTAYIRTKEKSTITLKHEEVQYEMKLTITKVYKYGKYNSKI